MVALEWQKKIARETLFSYSVFLQPYAISSFLFAFLSFIFIVNSVQVCDYVIQYAEVLFNLQLHNKERRGK